MTQQNDTPTADELLGPFIDSRPLPPPATIERIARGGYQMEPFIAHIYNVNPEAVTDDDYRRIARELHAQAGTWRQFVDLLSSRYSNAWWSRFVRSDITITRQAKNELRAAYGLALLPPTIGELAERLGPDTEVRHIQTPSQDYETITYPLPTPPHNAPGTPIPAPRRRAPTKAIRIPPTSGRGSISSARATAKPGTNTRPCCTRASSPTTRPAPGTPDRGTISPGGPTHAAKVQTIHGLRSPRCTPCTHAFSRHHSAVG